jgi:hypothetical protein
MCDPLEAFLVDYEELANAHQLSEAQRVESVIFYISAKLRDFWKSLDGYATYDWELTEHVRALSGCAQKYFFPLSPDLVRLQHASATRS